MERSSVGTTVRIVAVFAIVALALLSVLFVLDIVPKTAFAELTGKILMIAGIAVASLVALSFVLRK